MKHKHFEEEVIKEFIERFNTGGKFVYMVEFLEDKLKQSAERACEAVKVGDDLGFISQEKRDCIEEQNNKAKEYLN